MTKPTQKIPEPPQVLLHIGEWIVRLGRRPVDVAKAVGITESYLSELISNRKKNPSFKVLTDIADELRIPIDALRRSPPNAESVRAVRGLDPAVLDRLRPAGRSKEN